MCRPREPGRPGAAKLLGDDRNLAGPHTLNNHIHLLQRQHTGLHTALVAAEDICLETAIPCLRNSQRNNPRTGVKRARPVAVLVALPFIRAFVLVSPKAIRHLRLQIWFETASTSFVGPRWPLKRPGRVPCQHWLHYSLSL
jgi:hypothetical protein